MHRSAASVAFWDLIDKEIEVALLAVVGSHAYGTDRPDSDIDYRGFYVAPAENFWHVRPSLKPTQTIDRKDPDFVIYEVEKFMRLAAEANPNVLEVLWAPSIYERDDGDLIVRNRDAFLSKKVRVTYGGYARSQLMHAKKGTGGSRGRKHFKREKFILHLFRLMEQGTKLLADPDHFGVRVRDPEFLWSCTQKPLDWIEHEFDGLLEVMDEALENSPLPDQPDYARIDEMLVDIRRRSMLR